MKKITLLSIILLGLFSNFTANALSDDSYEASISFNQLDAVPLNAVRFPLMEIHIKANENIAISEIKLRRSGLSSWDDFGNIWAESGSYDRSLRSRLNSNDEANIKFRTPVNINAGETESFNVYINLALNNRGNTFSFSLEDIRIVNQNPAKLSRYSAFRARLQQNTSTSRNTSSISTYSVPALEFTALGASTIINIGETAEIGKFRLSNTANKDVFLKSIRFKNYGKSDLDTAFDNWSFSQNNEQITTQIITSEDYITFQFDDYAIGAGDAIMVRISGQLVSANTGDSVQLGIQFSSDILAELKNTSANASLTLNSSKLKKHTLGSGDWNFIQSYYQSAQRTYSRPTYRKTSNYSYTNSRASYAPGTKDVLFFHKYLHEKYNFRAEGLFIPVTSFQSKDSLEDSFNDFRLYIDGNLAGNTNDFETRNGRIGLLFNDDFEATKNADMRIVGRISHDAPNGSSLSFNFSQIEIFDKEWYWQ